MILAFFFRYLSKLEGNKRKKKTVVSEIEDLDLEDQDKVNETIQKPLDNHEIVKLAREKFEKLKQSVCNKDDMFDDFGSDDEDDDDEF